MYSLGNKSLSHLVAIHPVLVQVVKRAIELTAQDFGVYEGVRTLERQKKLKAAGASRILDSMHIPRKDQLGGISTWGHAVDLVPWIDGQWRWEWGPCYKIAEAMDAAATELNHADKLCWGGVWDRYMSKYDGDMKQAVYSYTVRHPGRDFIDGPHYQVGRLG